MSWSVEIIATNVYVPTDNQCRASSTTIDNLIGTNNAIVVALPIIAGDPDYHLAVDADVIGNDIATYAATYAARYTLTTEPLDWDGNYYSVISDIVQRRYHYVRNVNYPNWQHEQGVYYACSILDLSVEHKHNVGAKQIKLQLVITRR